MKSCSLSLWLSVRNIPEYISVLLLGTRGELHPSPVCGCWVVSTSHRGWNWVSRHVPVIFQSHDASDFASWISHNKKCSSWWSVLLPQQMILLLWDNRDSGLAARAGLIQTPSRRLFLPDDAASVTSVFTGPAGVLLIKYFFYWDVTRNRKNHICDVDFERKMANEGLALKWDSRGERIPGALHVLRHKELQVCLGIWRNSRGRGFLYEWFCKMALGGCKGEEGARPEDSVRGAGSLNPMNLWFSA